jgi:4-phytase/acid phosphatase
MRMKGSILFLIAALLAPMPGIATESAMPGMVLQRTVLLYRHGVRAPLDTEVQVNEANGKPWPQWPVAASLLTAHGTLGVKLMGHYDRLRLASAGLVPTDGCPAAGSTSFWANTDERTIASAQALADAFAPNCQLEVGHRPQGSEDPLFHPKVATDGTQAVAAITAQTGGPDALTGAQAKAMARFAAIMGCQQTSSAAACTIANVPGTLRASTDNHGVHLDGPIMLTSGTAEVLLMEYVEGMPMSDVGWGRADASALAQISRLHALLFEIHARPTYVAQRTAAVLNPHVVALLTDEHAPKLNVFVGSDNNISAFTSLLGIHFHMPGYGDDDPPVGGAFGMEVWRDAAGKRYVRAFYQAQSTEQLRALTPLTLERPPATSELPIPKCATPCGLDQFVAILKANQL